MTPGQWGAAIALPPMSDDDALGLFATAMGRAAARSADALFEDTLSGLRSREYPPGPSVLLGLD